MKKKKLYIFTASYPYGKGETFLENEIPILAHHFQKLIICPLLHATSEIRTIPANAEVRNIINGRKTLSSKKVFLNSFLPILFLMITEFIHCKNKFFFLKNFRYFNNLLIKAHHDAALVNEEIKNSKQNSIFYSFWMNDWALSLAILKRKQQIESFVFRCGGFDIYDERHKGNYLPFRYTIYKYTSAIFPNSNDGAHYIKTKTKFTNKIQTQYWGTKDEGNNNLSANIPFSIVSCSRIIPLKRINLIIYILKSITTDINWIHFGDGTDEKFIKEKAKELPANIHYTFKGNVSNQEIIEFYKTNAVNLFITTSETESLPMSIQEAISFGIPVIATNVGGIPEIVNNQTGILIDKNFDSKKVAEQIEDFITSDKNKEEFRNGVRNFWKENFDAEKVYTEFSKVLTKE